LTIQTQLEVVLLNCNHEKNNKEIIYFEIDFLRIAN